MESTKPGENWCSTAKFQASTTGSRMVLSLVNGSTFGEIPFGRMGLPVGPLGCVARIVEGSSAGGPVLNVKTGSQGFAGFNDWFASTGTFCVTLWPKETPNTPT